MVNYPFKSSDHYQTIHTFLDSRKDFIVLGLCGKTGSGATTTASILQQDFNQLQLSQPSDSMGDSIEMHEYRILYTYAQKHWRPFYRIKASALITARVLDEGQDKFLTFLEQLFPKLKDGGHAAKLTQAVSEFFNGEMTFWLTSELKLDPGDMRPAVETWFAQDEMPKEKEKELSLTPCFPSSPDTPVKVGALQRGVLSIEGQKIEYQYQYDAQHAAVSFKAKALYQLFKLYKQYRERKTGFKNPLLVCLLQRFIYDYLPEHCGQLWRALAQLEHGLEIIALQQLGNNLRISQTPYYHEDSHFIPEAYRTIVEDINHAIKLLGAYLAWRKRWAENLEEPKKSEYLAEKRTIICVDSIKNPYESMYLKSRYTNYYLLGIYTEDEMRYDRLLKTQRFPKTYVEAIDIIEQQSEFKAMLKSVDRLYEKLEQLKVRTLFEQVSRALEPHSQGSPKPDPTQPAGLNQPLFQPQYEEFCKAPIQSPGDYLHLLRLCEDILANQPLPDGQGEELTRQVRTVLEQVQTEGMALECSDIVLNARLTIKRLNLYDELPFIFQNVESCLRDADIFLNNESDDSQHLLLKGKLLRYVSLIMNPGLVLPSPVERCMQLAYTAKLNSGCISRQVGAAITDADYHLLSIGWNQQPEGQLPCSYRDLCALHYHWSPAAYSDFELDSKEQLQKRIRGPVRELLSSTECPLVEQGKLPAFCFKDLYNSITGFNNQVHPRSLHAEETAFLNLGQYSAEGGILFTTSSPCELCAKKAMYEGIRKIYYIEPYPGLSFRHVLSSGPPEKRPQLLLFTGAVGRAYTQLFTPLMPQKDELAFWLGAKIDANLLENIRRKEVPVQEKRCKPAGNGESKEQPAQAQADPACDTEEEGGDGVEVPHRFQPA